MSDKNNSLPGKLIVLQEEKQRIVRNSDPNSNVTNITNASFGIAAHIAHMLCG